nr:MAG TPA: hypothetical protein [Caudoviricetes sp.]
MIFIVVGLSVGCGRVTSPAQPSAPTVYVKQDVVGAWIIIDIQLYVPASRHE